MNDRSGENNGGAWENRRDGADQTDSEKHNRQKPPEEFQALPPIDHQGLIKQRESAESFDRRCLQVTLDSHVANQDLCSVSRSRRYG